MLARSHKGLTLSQITRNLSVARSSAFYILNTLEESGYVFRESPRGRYMFTTKLFGLASSSLVSLGVRQRAAPFLRGLMEQTNLTVHLAVIVQNELVLIDKVAPPGPLQLATWIGKRLPVHCTGAGKALLAYMPQDRLGCVLSAGLIRYNENTIVSPQRLREELHRIRTNGFAIDDEEETIGLRCIGAPVFDHHRNAIAAISIAGTTAQINNENLEKLSGLVKHTSDKISAVMPQEIA
jgi:DNA-binding IclR family transcriptional regulator